MTFSLDEARNRAAIEAYLRRDPVRHLYELGDLDEPHWSRARWFVAREGATIASLAMLYDTQPMPVFLAMSAGTPADAWLLDQVAPTLPAPVYVHLAEAQLTTMHRHRSTSQPLLHYRMSLSTPLVPRARLGVRPLGGPDLGKLQALLGEASPGHYFMPEMLHIGRYFGAFDDGRLVCSAGTHIPSRQSRTAALGNIATAPDRRGRGLATQVTHMLCASLASEVDIIGLNVSADNVPAVRCYERLGFQTVCRFFELVAK